jgi:tetratricopeptide (TPR) repeat protein
MVSERAFEDFVMGLSGHGMSGESMEQEVRSFGEKYPYVADIFSDLLWYGGENEQANAIEILRLLASERAVATLEAFALSQVGNDDLRVAAAHALMSLGVFTDDKPVRFWLKGQWRDMLLRRQIITEERELEYSDYIIALLEEATIAFRQGREEEAEELFKKAIALEPTAKQAYGNLGALYFKQGRHDEAERSLQKAIEIDLDYVFPRCNLASMRIQQGRLEEAEDLLKPIAELGTLHPQEFLFYNRISADLFMALDRYDLAEQCLEMILEMEPENEDAQTRLLQVRMVRDSDGHFARWRERARQKREKRRRRPLTGMDLQPCLSRHIKDNLVAMARALGVRVMASIRKAELIALLAESLANPEVVGRAWRSLTSEEQEALRFISARGGMVPYNEVNREYGDDFEDPYYWHYHEPETTIGRLRLHGLLFEGAHEDEVVLVIPTEVRELLAGLLKT